MSEWPRRVAVIGLGVIGGSFGMALKRLSDLPQVVGWSRRAETAPRAVERGAVDEAAPDARTAAKGADLVYIATPVGSVAELALEIAGELGPGAIITDGGSTKKSIVQALAGRLPEGVAYIGGHPMAGSERTGIDAARADLFDGAYYLLTPTDETDTASYGRLHGLLTRIGANVVAIDPDTHDSAVAAISHVPHLIATALVNLATEQAAGNPNLLRMAAGGFKDMTRIAAGSPEMWADICAANAPAIGEMLARFRIQLDQLGGAVAGQRKDQVAHELERAANVRRELPQLWQAQAADLVEVLVPMSDRPGVISDVTMTIGTFGINVEDIEIAHESATSAVLRLVVEDAPRLGDALAALRDRGFDAQARPLSDLEPA
jgi:prephenate dehydrogenase